MIDTWQIFCMAASVNAAAMLEVFAEVSNCGGVEKRRMKRMKTNELERQIDGEPAKRIMMRSAH